MSQYSILRHFYFFCRDIEYCDKKVFILILGKVAKIKDPFEQSFFLMVHLPYLQPFDDVNKRVSRLEANIPLVKQNLSPLSFIDVPEDIYFQGMMSIYEQNDISLLKDVFIWSYERSAAQYKVIRQSLGERDAFKLKYRIPIRLLITSIVIEADSNKDVLDYNASRPIQKTYPSRIENSLSGQ